MYPNLYTVPGLELELTSYGIMLMLGMLAALYLAVRRAVAVHADPDIILNMGFLSLVGGLAGARLFYVIHYWPTRFAPYYWHDNHSFWANIASVAWGVVDVSRGGLEFYGGWIGAMVVVVPYLYWRRVSLRWYLDLVAPSLFVGLALGRVGCFLNGCCWGRVCRPDAFLASLAVTFPAGSPPMSSQWQMHDIALPPVMYYNFNSTRPELIPTRDYATSQQRIDAVRNRLTAIENLEATQPEIARMQRAELREQEPVAERLSRHLALHQISMDQLREIAASVRSRPIYPVQLMATLSAITLWLLMEALLRYRRVHGTVILAACVFYPVNRILEEQIRNDNPFDSAGLTVSQFTAVCFLVAAGALALAMRRWLPAISPRCRPVVL